jgi:hypothetical protein
MPEAPFDVWTRRRFGLATGGGLAALLGLAATEVVEAKKHKNTKKRCRKLGRKCKPNGKRTCCGKLKCDATGFASELPMVCCKRKGKPCGEDRECCSGLACCGSPSVCSPNCVSDRAKKTNFGSIDTTDMLERVRSLPIATWNYTSDDPSIRHIGPMAQDFAALFGVGADDRHIHPLDGQGVALAAIQGLLGEIQILQADNARLAARVAALEGSPSDTR